MHTALSGRNEKVFQYIIWFFPFHRSRLVSENSRNLKNAGLKATYPRLKILDLFQHAQERHLTAEDVYRHL